MRTLFFALLLCAPGDGRAAGADKGKPKAVPPPAFCIFGGQSGKPFGDLASFKSVVWKSDVVYAGGASGRSGGQQVLLEILKAMREARGARVAVGFEALDMPLQPVLDEYAAGGISEEEFLKRTGWAGGPDGDFALYRPVFDFIIRNKLRALALNVPEEIISRIEREGLGGLGEEDRKFLPAKVDVSRNKKYLEFLKAAFDRRGGAAAGAAAWDNYLAAAAAWNEGAGSRIAGFMAANPGWALLVAAGNDRLLYNAALPASVKSRTEKIRQASFYSEAEAKCPAALPKERKDLANYVWYVSRSTGTAAGQ